MARRVVATSPWVSLITPILVMQSLVAEFVGVNLVESASRTVQWGLHIRESPMLSAEISDILAFCALGALCSVFVGWVVLMMRRSPFSPAQSLLYTINYVLVRVLWRARIHGRFPLAPGQGGIIVCNHRCPLDPSFIALTMPRVVHWMVAKEYCEFPPFRKMLQLCGVVPVSRGGVDTAAIKVVIRIVQQGGVVGIFPEGRINDTDDLLLPGRSGAALVALKARAVVVPGAISTARPTTDRLWAASSCRPPFGWKSESRSTCRPILTVRPIARRSTP